MGFVPLHVISSYSLLQSTIELKTLVTTAVERGYKALALTENNVMYGTVEFYQACQQAGIQPIIGLTLTLEGILASDQQFPLIFWLRI